MEIIQIPVTHMLSKKVSALDISDKIKLPRSQKLRKANPWKEYLQGIPGPENRAISLNVQALNRVTRSKP